MLFWVVVAILPRVSMKSVKEVLEMQSKVNPPCSPVHLNTVHCFKTFLMFVKLLLRFDNMGLKLVEPVLKLL